MKKHWPLAAAITAHALLIGLLTGLSLSPIVGTVLPLLMGVSGYKLLDSLTGSPASTSPQTGTPWTVAGIGWAVALWCTVVIASIFAGIALRNGYVHFGPPPATTLSLVHLEHQRPARIPQIALICAYYDRMDLTTVERSSVAQALSDSSIDADVLLASLKDYFSSDHAAAATPQRSPIGVYEYRPPRRSP
jgi:hypothetical protein